MTVVLSYFHLLSLSFHSGINFLIELVFRHWPRSTSFHVCNPTNGLSKIYAGPEPYTLEPFSTSTIYFQTMVFDLLHESIQDNLDLFGHLAMESEGEEQLKYYRNFQVRTQNGFFRW